MMFQDYPEEAHSETLQLLLQRYPEGAHITDANGMLPLHYADGLECVRILVDFDLFTVLHICNDGSSVLQLAFTRDSFPLPLATRQFLLEKQDEALQRMHGAFEPTANYFLLPDLVVAEVWSFVFSHNVAAERRRNGRGCTIFRWITHLPNASGVDRAIVSEPA